MDDPEPPAVGCPPWCRTRHGGQSGEEDLLHLGTRLLVRDTAVRLCASSDPRSSEIDGPFVVIGPWELTLYEADALIGALTHVVDSAMTPSAPSESLLPQQPEGTRAVADP